MSGDLLTEPPAEELATWRREILRSYVSRRVASANDEHPLERANQRAFSRHLIETDGIAGGAIDTNCSHVIGTGLSMRSAIDPEALGISPERARKWKAERDLHFDMWASSTLSDVTESTDFYGLQELALRAQLSSGDVFALLVDMGPRKGWPFRLAVQLIEADLVCNPMERDDRIQATRDGPAIIDGVELNDAGAPAAIHVADRYRDETRPLPEAFKRSWRRIPMVAPSGRRNVLFLRDQKRPGQVRGVPLLRPVFKKLKELSIYSEAEIEAAASAAMLLLFVTMDPKAFDELFGSDAQKDAIISGRSAWNGALQPRTAVNLLPGEHVEEAENKRASANFDPFFMACVKQIAVGIEMPFEVLIKHFTASYTASRAAFMEAYRTFRRRRDRVFSAICQPVYDEWLADEVAIERAKAPGFWDDPIRRYLWSAAQWVGDSQGLLNPLQEMQAIQMGLDMGITTRDSESIKFDGIPWEQKSEQLAREHKARVEAGLETELPDPNAMPTAGGAPAAGGKGSSRPPKAPSRPMPGADAENAAGVDL